MNKTIKLNDDQISMIIGALERSIDYYFNNCGDQDVDNEWCYLHRTITYLTKILNSQEDEDCKDEWLWPIE